jgi:hypothetical protein
MIAHEKRPIERATPGDNIPVRSDHLCRPLILASAQRSYRRSFLQFRIEVNFGRRLWRVGSPVASRQNR